MKRLFFCSLILFIFSSCKIDENGKDTSMFSSENDKEAHEDSLALKAAYMAQDKISWSVYPTIETEAISANTGEDAADDPAIWIHPNDPSKSLIYGSNKKGGLAVYNLNGEEIAYYPIGNINNVDVLYKFPVEDKLVSILGCSNRSDQSIDLFLIDQNNGILTDIASGMLTVDTTLIDDIYGFCFSVDYENNSFYCNINGKNGMFQQFIMRHDSTGIRLEFKRSIQFDSQTEGMVADNEFGNIYVGEEGRGIWRLKIDPSVDAGKQLLKGSDISNPNIVYDIEGLSIYKNNGKGYLIASSQGNFTYAIFDRLNDNRFLGSFKISPFEDIDGVEETDGLDVVSDSLNPRFPKGLLVVQDGFNYEEKTLKSQNFKLVSFKNILDGISFQEKIIEGN